MKKTYPIRLREDWANAYTGFDGGSQMPEGLTEQMTEDYFICAGRYLEWLHTEGISAFDKLARAALKHDELFTKFSNFGHGTLVGIQSYFVDYIKDNAGVSNKSLGKLGLPRNHPFPADGLIKLANYVQSHEQLSFKSFLEYWFDRVKPQYTQTCLLHSVDGLIFAKTKYPELQEPADLLLKGMEDAGFIKAANTIRNLVSKEGPEEALHRLTYQAAVRAGSRELSLKS